MLALGRAVGGQLAALLAHSGGALSVGGLRAAAALSATRTFSAQPSPADLDRAAVSGGAAAAPAAPLPALAALCRAPGTSLVIRAGHARNAPLHVHDHWHAVEGWCSCWHRLPSLCQAGWCASLVRQFHGLPCPSAPYLPSAGCAGNVPRP